jgi:hypothetical protein
LKLLSFPVILSLQSFRLFFWGVEFSSKASCPVRMRLVKTCKLGAYTIKTYRILDSTRWNSQASGAQWQVDVYPP